MKNFRQRIKVMIKVTDEGFEAVSQNPKIISRGKDIPEIYSSILKGINSIYNKSGIVVTAENLKIKIDLRHLYPQYCLLNIGNLSKETKISRTLLSQYIRGKQHPSLKQAERIVEGMRKIGKELSKVTLYSKEMNLYNDKADTPVVE